MVLAREELPATPSRVPCYLVMLLRDELTLLVPALEKATLGLPKGDGLAVRALARAAEARTRLGLTAGALAPGKAETEQWVHAQFLARSVNCLRRHLEKLEGLDREPVKYCRRCSRSSPTSGTPGTPSMPRLPPFPRCTSTWAGNARDQDLAEEKPGRLSRACPVGGLSGLSGRCRWFVGGNRQSRPHDANRQGNQRREGRCHRAGAGQALRGDQGAGRCRSGCA
ncbi:DUF6415 family natural product biosynthesis protein [Streptomyces capitiformicae]|uniref:DUF6415 family natural product biosynthesis protein n=1 Tax=Streptomyces capitiformicae TaxID=2014920 RepID=UPI0038CD67AC